MESISLNQLGISQKFYGQLCIKSVIVYLFKIFITLWWGFKMCILSIVFISNSTFTISHAQRWSYLTWHFWRTFLALYWHNVLLRCSLSVLCLPWLFIPWSRCCSWLIVSVYVCVKISFCEEHRRIMESLTYLDVACGFKLVSLGLGDCSRTETNADLLLLFSQIPQADEPIYTTNMPHWPCPMKEEQL